MMYQNWQISGGRFYEARSWVLPNMLQDQESLPIEYLENPRCTDCRITQNLQVFHRFCPRCFIDSWIPFTCIILSFYLQIPQTQLHGQQSMLFKYLL